MLGTVAGGGFGSWRHLAGRFFGALSPAGPDPADERWAEDHLLEGERDLWRRMSGPDRRHAVGVARETIRLLAPRPADRDVVAAALLHDVGKVESGFGTIGRAAVTFVAMVIGRDRLLRWAEGGRRPTSVRARVGRYLSHDGLGAALLAASGSTSLTVDWAAQHHLPAERWTLEPAIADALKAADGD